MERREHRRSSPSERFHGVFSSPPERFLGVFSSPPGTLTAATGGAGVELDEEEVLWSGSDFSASNIPPQAASGGSPKVGTISPSVSSPRSFRRISEKNFGILAALPEEEKKMPVRNPSFLQRTASSLSGPSSTSTSPSPSSSARLIPVVPRPKNVDYSMSALEGKIQQQSAPVNVPVVRSRQRRGLLEKPDEDYGNSETLPPHEMVARKDSPMTTFSVLEGAGRTLKGRDLRQVRNAVWRQTGFID